MGGHKPPPLLLAWVGGARSGALVSLSRKVHIRRFIMMARSGERKHTPDCEENDGEGIQRVIHLSPPSPQTAAVVIRSGPSISLLAKITPAPHDRAVMIFTWAESIDRHMASRCSTAAEVRPASDRISPARESDHATVPEQPVDQNDPRPCCHLRPRVYPIRHRG